MLKKKPKRVPDSLFFSPLILLRCGIFFSSLLKVVMAGDDLQSGWRKEDEASQEPLVHSGRLFERIEWL